MKSIFSCILYIHNKKLIHLLINLNNLGVHAPSKLEDTNLRIISLNQELCQIDYTKILKQEEKKEKKNQDKKIIELCNKNISKKENKTGELNTKLHNLYNLNDNDTYSVRSDYWSFGVLIIELIFKLYNVNFNEKFEDNKTKFIDIFKEPKKIDDILEFIFDNKNYVFSKATKDFILKFLEYSIDDDSFSYKKIIKKFEKELIKPEFKLLKNKEDEEESSRNNLIKEKRKFRFKN